MALNHKISDQVLEVCINAIPSKKFNTYAVIGELEKRYPEILVELRSDSPKGWASVVGIALSRFSKQTGHLDKITPNHVSPAWWEKV